MMIIIDNKQYIIEEWFLEKYNINIHRAYISKETEMAVLLEYETLKGIKEKWVPKSVMKEIDLKKQKKLF